MADQSRTRYSYTAKVSDVVNIQFPVAANMAWDGYARHIYDKTNSVIQQQAKRLLQRGNITHEEARQLVEVQRNGLVIEMRRRLSPFGRFYSEALKPSKNLPTLDTLLRKKGNIEAVLLSVGKTRSVVNRIAFVGRMAGSAGIVIEIVAVGVVIEKAPQKDKARVATEEFAGAIGGLAAGTGGMWAGAAAGAAWAGTWAAPSLMIPVVGELAEGGAIVLGGIAGGMMASWLGHHVGKEAAENIWRLAPIKWK
ncbi:hypothetical protein [Paraburkholderia tuberum]|uniref:Uncharacterized protein n=1 Tax=Paraburkholderia tuberum TaxID=157910 RepID=A0A1H1HM91_9BURK|nr:hypothetical protein [Paraburkholderia tuberum]SDR26459.1 hypothetical protein SAMN05445850_3696 [Paraburkholderia tuberum]